MIKAGASSLPCSAAPDGTTIPMLFHVTRLVDAIATMASTHRGRPHTPTLCESVIPLDTYSNPL